MVLIGYKKCFTLNNDISRVIGVFEISDDAIICPQKTNDYARYRVNKCKLISVQTLNGVPLPEVSKVEGVSFTDYDPSITFEIGKETILENFADNQNRLDTGILMFFSQHRAQNYLIETVRNGILNTWDNEGILRSKESFLDGFRHGFCTYYNSNGTIKEEVIFSFGLVTGIQNFYDINGNKKKEINHSKGIEIYTRYT